MSFIWKNTAGESDIKIINTAVEWVYGTVFLGVYIYA